MGRAGPPSGETHPGPKGEEMEYGLLEYALAVVFWGFMAFLVIMQVAALWQIVVGTLDGSMFKGGPWIGGAGSNEPMG